MADAYTGNSKLVLEAKRATAVDEQQLRALHGHRSNILRHVLEKTCPPWDRNAINALTTDIDAYVFAVRTTSGKPNFQKAKLGARAVRQIERHAGSRGVLKPT